MPLSTGNENILQMHNECFTYALQVAPTVLYMGPGRHTAGALALDAALVLLVICSSQAPREERRMKTKRFPRMKTKRFPQAQQVTSLKHNMRSGEHNRTHTQHTLYTITIHNILF